MRAFLTALALPILAASAASAAHNDPAVPAVTRDKVELVFVLDTTGSMSGLIEGAKRKIWFVANEIMKSERRPELRVGLVAYRDKGDAYITKALPLTDDLDKVYETLMAYRADGGGDGPEHVNAGLYDAVHKMQWSGGKDVLKLIFLVGDAPPHMDYSDDVKHTKTSQVAVRQNIYINTLQCGADPATTRAWTKIARNSEGRYAAIPQDGGVVAIATPFDDELGRLADKLDDTELTYGTRARKDSRRAMKARTSSLAKAGPASTAADRALVKGKMAAPAEADFVERVARDEGAYDKVADDDLPDELQGKTRAEQKRIVAERVMKREEIRKQIATLEKKREAHISKERAKKKGKDAFDLEVVETIKAEAAERGMSL
jgi:hypothetical protein